MLSWMEIGSDIVFLGRAGRHDTDSGVLSALLVFNMEVSAEKKKLLQNLKVENYVLFIRLSEVFKPRKQNSQITLRSCSEEVREEPGIYGSFVTKPGSWNIKILLLINENQTSQAFLVAQMLKNLPAMLETWVQSLGQEDPMEEVMATHSSILAWRIPMDRGAQQATVHWIAKSRAQLK